MIGFLRHAKYFLPIASLKTLYTGIVEPHFRYCCSVWGCAGSTDINQLKKLQNRAANSWAGRPLMNSLTMRVKQWSSSRSVIWLLNNLFTKNSACSSRSLWNTDSDLRLPKKRSANGQKCFSFLGAKLWNSLPAESKKASSLGGFKKSIQG